MTKNIGIDNPQIQTVKCVGTLNLKTCVESPQKQTMRLIFNIQNSQFLN